jgi:hypothetical protein
VRQDKKRPARKREREKFRTRRATALNSAVPSVTDFETDISVRPGAVSMRYGLVGDMEDQLSISSVQSSPAVEGTEFKDFEPVANVIDPADLEAEVMDRILDNAVVAKVVKDRSVCWKCTVAAILLVAMIAIVLGITEGTKSREQVLPLTLAPSSSPSQMPSTDCETLCQGINDSTASLTDDNIKEAILEYIQNPSNSPYGSIINCWDVSKVTNMSFAFNQRECYYRLTLHCLHASKASNKTSPARHKSMRGNIATAFHHVSTPLPTTQNLKGEKPP